MRTAKTIAIIPQDNVKTDAKMDGWVRIAIKVRFKNMQFQFFIWLPIES
jgi:hypothetical protein